MRTMPPSIVASRAEALGKNGFEWAARARKVQKMLDVLSRRSPVPTALNAVHKALDHLVQAECDAAGSENEDALRRIDWARKCLIRADLRETIEVIARAAGVEI